MTPGTSVRSKPCSTSGCAGRVRRRLARPGSYKTVSGYPSADGLFCHNCRKRGVAVETRTKTYKIVDSGRDEYPGDGLRLQNEKGVPYDKDFMQDMGIESSVGDEVEITVRLVSRLETRRVQQ